MGRWLDRYLDGDCLETWVTLYGYGKQCREDPEFEDWDDVVAVVRETMRRTRRNVERLVELLPAAGWQFRNRESVHVPPPEGIETDLDALEGEIGRLPLSLRFWLEEVGTVSLAGTNKSWDYDFVDYLEVETSVAAIRREYADWRDARGRGWRLPFRISIAPDYLHKNDVGGGASYSLIAPDDDIDGFLWNEYHQTTFVNYLRIAFTWGGLLGWDRPGLPSAERYAGDPPQALWDIASKLEPI
jgi:hypothetical protein